MKALLLAALASTVSAQSPIYTRVIEREPFFYEPATHCDLPRMAVLVANAAMIPAGVESMPGICEPYSPRGKRVLIKGMAVAAVLDKLVSLDPRYRWKDVDGVIVVRPVDAWDNTSHFLHKTVPSFEHDDLSIAKAWTVFLQALGPQKYRVDAITGVGASSPLDTYRFAVRLPPSPTKLDILNGIARAHGSMFWEIEYCASVMQRNAATFKFMGQATIYEPEKERVGLFGPGMIGGRVYETDANGQRVSPCEPLK